jgi:two-component system chemotaxis response regulator CheB
MVEKVRVLVVDDSSFFRKRIRHELEPGGDILVVGEAANGREAVELAASLKPDLITMDVAMPLMDGISAVRKIMRSHPTDIMMFSALTREGARATLDALDAGAVDFLAKQDGLNGTSDASSGSHLRDRVITITRSPRAPEASSTVPNGMPPVRKAPEVPAHSSERRRHPPGLVVIGASTGGPVAVQRVLAGLPAGYPFPVLVAVHMPAEFTPTFAERLDTVCRVKVKHADDMDALTPGRVLIAPGGMQTLVESRHGELRVKIKEGGDQLYRPSVDILFGSAARALGDAAQAVVLTGMGSDGTEGARLLKQRGASVWSQDQATSVVYGMPYSVVKAGYADRVMSLGEIGAALSGLA